jgi:bifunctional enzyme CysN/CysC
MRTGLNSDLGFGREARMENARRAAEVSVMFADAGLVALVALISPYAESRQLARQMHERAGLPFAEVYLAAPVDLCSTRDPKGLYAKAAAGEIASFTGIDDPYEVPTVPELAIEPGTPVDDVVDLVLAALATVEVARDAR